MAWGEYRNKHCAGQSDASSDVQRIVHAVRECGLNCTYQAIPQSLRCLWGVSMILDVSS